MAQRKPDIHMQKGETLTTILDHSQELTPNKLRT